jgi:hypothetical protein
MASAAAVASRHNDRAGRVFGYVPADRTQHHGGECSDPPGPDDQYQYGRALDHPGRSPAADTIRRAGCRQQAYAEHGHAQPVAEA